MLQITIMDNFYDKKYKTVIWGGTTEQITEDDAIDLINKSIDQIKEYDRKKVDFDKLLPCIIKFETPNGDTKYAEVI